MCAWQEEGVFILLLTNCYLLPTTYPREEGLGLAAIGQSIAIQVEVDVEPG